jgi:aspartate carbamoyltransferase catalytic subunit
MRETARTGVDILRTNWCRCIAINIYGLLGTPAQNDYNCHTTCKRLVMREPTTTTRQKSDDPLSPTNSGGARLWKERRHLLDTSDLQAQEIATFLEVARKCKQNQQTGMPLSILQGVTVASVFYENSTRTRSSFEVAARRLGADVLNLDTKVSSVTKGESITDTAGQLVAMQVAAIVQRHNASGSADLLVSELGDKVHVINAGDGWHAHPTQALLDLLTMTEVKADLRSTKVAIIGDITHSRVARSNIWLLKKQGADVHVAGPPTLLPPGLSELGVTVHNRLEPAIENADFVIMLRLQLERQKQGLIPSISEYKSLFRLDHSKLKLAKPQSKVLHPGPVNRDIEITDALVDDESRSLISLQVANGVAARMAVLYLLLAAQEGDRS